MCVSVGLGVKMQEGDNKKARKMNFLKKTCIFLESGRGKVRQGRKELKVFPLAAMLEKRERLHVVLSCGLRKLWKDGRVVVLFEKRL